MSETLMREVAGRAPGGTLLGSNHSSVTGWLCDFRHQSPSSLSLPTSPSVNRTLDSISLKALL